MAQIHQGTHGAGPMPLSKVGTLKGALSEYQVSDAHHSPDKLDTVDY